MAESLVEWVDGLHAALASFEPEVHSGEDCATLVEKLAAVEKVSAAARVRAAARAGECGAHRERGFAEVSDWMARATGSTAGAAKSALATAAALASQPDAKAALEAGELSFAQARELVKAEAAVPGSTAGLLDVAKGQSLRTLKEQARDRRLRAIDPEELHALQHAAMYHRHWTTALGTIAYAGELPPEIGIPFTTILDAETDRLWLKAHQDANPHGATGQQHLADPATDADATNCTGDGAGTAPTGSGAPGSGAPGSGAPGSGAPGSGAPGSGASGSGASGSGASGSGASGSGASGSGASGSDTGGSGAPVELRRSALAAQAFVRMMEDGGGKGKAGRADMVVVCDLRAYRRGHALEGEACHIVGGGSIPVSLARELGRDAFLNVATQ